MLETFPTLFPPATAAFCVLVLLFWTFSRKPAEPSAAPNNKELLSKRTHSLHGLVCADDAPISESVVLGAKLASTFSPPSWLSHPDVQTVLGSLSKTGSSTTHRRKRIDTEDDDFLDVDYLESPAHSLPADAPIAVLVHGLGGDSGSTCIVHLASLLLEKGMRPVAVNLRGASGTPNLAQKLHHAGAYEDILHVIESLMKWHPETKKFALVGYSLGGSITLNLMGRLGSRLPEPLICAAAISPPLDLVKGADALESGPGRKWSAFLLSNLRKLLHPRLDSFNAPNVDAKRAYSAKTLREFDHHFTAPLHGYSGWLDYYTRASSLSHLPSITRPTMIIRAKDDPFLSADDNNHRNLTENPNVVPVITEHGGHMGFVSWKGFGFEAWAERTVADWVGEKVGAV